MSLKMLRQEEEVGKEESTNFPFRKCTRHSCLETGWMLSYLSTVIINYRDYIVTYMLKV